MAGWIGVDLDGTLAVHDHETFDVNHIGEPVPLMLERVGAWLDAGIEVRIVTARVGAVRREEALAAFATVAMADVIAACGEEVTQLDVEEIFLLWQRALIVAWCEAHLGKKLPVTDRKDFRMWELWDDRAVQVVHNTGVRVGDVPAGIPATA